LNKKNIVACLAFALAAFGARDADAARTLPEYRWFRALSIDLQGRIPTRDEIAAFEDPAFDADGWIEQRLGGQAYSERLQRVYMDRLRLELGPTFRYLQYANILKRFIVKVAEPDGTTSRVWVYARYGQQRNTASLDRYFCFSGAETGQTYSGRLVPSPDEPTIAVPRAVFDTRTKKVRPWWLYRDYRAPAPTQHYSTWSASEPRFALAAATDKKGAVTNARDERLLVNPDGSEAKDVFVCNEEANPATSVEITRAGTKVDLSCASQSAFSITPACGCGPGLEYCMPSTGFGGDPTSLIQPRLMPLGPDMPFARGRERQSQWWRTTWADEARHFLGTLFEDDVDFRQVLTGRWGVLNGPLTQFYRGIVGGDCCTDLQTVAGPQALNPIGLVDVSKLPDVAPTEVDRWVRIQDRGPHAAGLLTTTAFLAKYASRRGRANAVYNAFLCREFVAENLDLAPSSEPNLMVRPGCSTCHAKLEPLAAYFARTKEGSFNWLSAPIDNTACALGPDGTMTNACERYYDPSFSSATAGKLRGAHASAENVESGPAGLAAMVAGSPDFSACVARTVAESLLGRATTEEDTTWLAALDRSFVEGGFRMKPLVRSVLSSDAYRNANALGGGR
jgi:hypothetical protein